jgi:hypothetical protein
MAVVTRLNGIVGLVIVRFSARDKIVELAKQNYLEVYQITGRLNEPRQTYSGQRASEVVIHRICSNGWKLKIKKNMTANIKIEELAFDNVDDLGEAEMKAINGGSAAYELGETLGYFLGFACLAATMPIMLMY